ncbi:hypothetical protein [Acidithiobacillus ferriphilus]|uniref:hypothetical protein n=1 Tax=Acidithiobacillus ferriphilus TaxID=1689834 RepID=UPI004057CB48
MTDNLPFVLATPADDYACGRYRVSDPFAALVGSGLVDGVNFPYFLDDAVLRDLNPDVVIVQRVLEHEQIDRLERYRRVGCGRIVFDLDDLLTITPRDNKCTRRFHTDVADRLSRAMSLCDRLVFSTDSLSDHFTHADKVVCQNSLPDSPWGNLRVSCRLGDKPRIGWAGSAGHLGDLKLLYKVVPALADLVDWVFMGQIPQVIARHCAEVHPLVPIDQYPQRLADLGLDLAVAPLQSHPYNDAKSSLRLLELGACGYPVICSDVDAFAVQLPVHRCSDDPADWIEAIRGAIADRAALAAWGDRMRADVLGHWLLSGRVGHWFNAWCSPR